MSVQMRKQAMEEAFAEFIFETHYEELPTQVIQQAKRCVLDFLGVALAGSDVGLAPIITRSLFEMGGKKDATIIGDGSKVPALNAALINAVRGHTLDMDDGHRYANAHPGVVIIPAALALAERESSKGKALIEATVVGYETFIRIAKAVNPSHLSRGFHTTGTVGPFGAAAACSKLLELNEKETKNALSIAGLMGSGLLEVMNSGQMMKPFHPGRASQAGVLASLLAKEGAEGPELTLEGEKGFFKAFSDGTQASQVTKGLGRDFEIMNVYFKLHAACRHIHPTLDAIMEIMTKNPIDSNEILNIDVKTYSVAFSLTGHNREINTELAAKFSLPISTALMLRYGRTGYDEYSMEHIRDPLIHALAGKVKIAVDKTRDDVYPHERGASVKIVSTKGTYRSDVALPKGEPENPLSEDELSDKFNQNAKKILSPAKIDQIRESVFDIENKSIRELMKYAH